MEVEGEPKDEFIMSSKASDFGLAAVNDQYVNTQSAKKAYDRETNARKREYLDKLATLHEERLKAMLKASMHAGNIGLIYVASVNDFFRVIVSDALPKMPERPRLSEFVESVVEQPPHLEPMSVITPPVLADQDSPEPSEGVPKAERATVEAPSGFSSVGPMQPVFPQRPMRPTITDAGRKWDKFTSIKSGASWICSVLVGLFVGFGLLTLTGLPYTRPEHQRNLWLMMTLGIAAIVGIKLLFDAMWFKAGREAELHPQFVGTRRINLVLYTVVTISFIGVEALLGGYALVAYSKKTTFGGEGALSLVLAVGLAAAVSTATLLYSGFIGFQKGQRSIDEKDRAQAEYRQEMEEYEERCRALQAAYETEVGYFNDDIKAQRALVNEKLETERELLNDSKRTHQEMMEQWKTEVTNTYDHHRAGVSSRVERMQEFESLMKLPDFQALCQCVGIVDAITLHMQELKKQKDDELISRGHSRKNII